VTGGIRWAVIGSVVLLAACASSDDVAPVTSGRDGTASAPTVPETGPAEELAPSQLSSPTAPPPDTPPPCDPADLSLWTARVEVRDHEADAVVRVRNDGAVWCEVDVSASPSVDPLMEPDVWLEPGAWADLLVGPGRDPCADPAIVTAVDVDVNGTPVVVPTAAVVRCGWQLVAFYPTEVSADPCDDLALAVVDAAVVIRNSGPAACRLGSLVSVDGEPAVDDPGAGEIAVPVLAPGDVVAVPIRTAAGAARPVTLGFDSGVAVEVALALAEPVAGGAPGPWIGGPGAPTADDPAVLMAALDPF
jgi:hypothetical protein